MTADKIGPRIFGLAHPDRSYREIQKARNSGGTHDDQSCQQSHSSAPSKTHISVSSRLGAAKGIAAVATSALVFSLLGVTVRAVSDIFPATQTMLVRSVIQALFALIYLIWYRLPLLGNPQVRGWVTLRGTLGAINNWIFFYAVIQIPLGDANAIIFTAPVFTAVLACCLLGEPILLVEVVACTTSILGVVLVAHPSFLFGDRVGMDSMGRQFTVGLCLLAAFLNGLVFIVVRRVGKEAHWMSYVFSFSVNGIAFSSAALLLGVEKANWPEIHDVGIRPYALLGVVGVTACVGQSLYNFGMQREKAATASITRQLDVPLAFLWQLLLFQEHAIWMSAVGASTVVASTTLILGNKLCCLAPERRTELQPVPDKETGQCALPDEEDDGENATCASETTKIVCVS